MKTVKVKAYKKLSPTGKIENVDAHMRKIEAAQKMIAKHEGAKREVMARNPGIRSVAIEKFINDNSLNPERMLSSIKSKKIVGGDLVTAIAGKPNNRYFTKVVQLSK